MHLLVSLIQQLENSAETSTLIKLLTLLSAIGLGSITKQSHKQLVRRKWLALKLIVKNRLSKKREKGGGSMVLLLLLLIIGGGAILWILWALGGWFALILGIVGMLGVISLLL
jgi:hypothetical protein